MPWEDWRRLDGVVLLVSIVSSSSSSSLLWWSVKRRLRDGGDGLMSIVKSVALTDTYYDCFDIKGSHSNK